MPPKGYKKGHVKHPETGEYIDPRVLHKEEEKKIVKIPSKPVVQATKDELGPSTKNVKEGSDHSKVLIVWRDARGKQRTTQYTMADLTVNESINEEFNGAKKTTRIHISLDGVVLEKI